MCWKRFQERAAELGFSLEYRIRREAGRDMGPELTANADSGWFLVGNYDHVAGIWAKPVTDAARCLPRRRAAAALADCDPFVETVGEYGADFFAAAAPFREAVHHPENGCMLE